MFAKMKNRHNKCLFAIIIASAILSSFGILAQSVFATATSISNSVTTSNGNTTVSDNTTVSISGNPTVFLNDRFDTDLEGWTHYGYPGYVISLDTTTGQSTPSANISGDAWLGICSNHGMAKTVDIGTYLGGPLTLAFNWRASSTSGGAGLTTQAEVRVDNADTGEQLFTHRLVNSGISDTGWQYYSTDISSYVKSVKKVQIDLYLYDCWVANWNENNWYDNVSLFTGTTIPPDVTINANASTTTTTEGTSISVTASNGNATASNNATVTAH